MGGRSGYGRRARAQGRIESLTFYLYCLDGLTHCQKSILLLVADAERRGQVFQPSLPALGKMLSGSRLKAWRALRGLDGSHGWIRSEWRGGRQTNVYAAGWRLARILDRISYATLRKKEGQQ